MRRFLLIACLVANIAFGLAATIADAAEARIGDRVFTLPDGMTIELVASSPLVDRPIVADLDEEGRLYVADSSGSNESVARQLETRPHRIVRLEDLDGDGRYDRSTVFADRMMFPEGAMWLDGSLYVAAPPSIWKLTDHDDDGFADERIEWFQGGTLTGCANDLHGPYEGLDGWIYWAKGAFAEQRHERPGREPFVTRAAHIFRARRDGSGIEPVMTGGMDNPVEVVFTPEGERIFTTTFFQHPGGGRRDGLVHALYGGVYGKVHGVIDGHPRTRSDVLPVLTHLGPAAPAGLEILRSERLGAEFRGDLLAALFNLHKITRHELEPDGASFRTRDSDFLVCDDPDFHPTDVLEDADGSVLIVDTGGWYKICCPSSQLWKPDVLGAIYRVRRADGSPIDDPRGAKLAWTGASDADLARRLGDARPVVRDRARDALAARGDDALAALEAALREGSEEARRTAVWALCRIGSDAARETLRSALSDPSARVRQAAAHAVGLLRDRGALDELTLCLRDGEPAVRRAAAEALGRVGRAEAVPAILAAVAEASDFAIEHSLTFALIEIAAADEARRGLEAEEPGTRRAALVALDQMPGGGLAPERLEAFLASDDSSVRETARWILGRHPAWAGSLVSYFERELRAAASDPEARRDLVDDVARFTKESSIARLVARLARDDAASRASRSAAFEVMARSRLERAPGEWRDALATAIESGDPELGPRALEAALAISSANDRHDSLAAVLARIARDSANSPATRLRALAALPTSDGGPDPGVFSFLRSRLSGEATLAERGRAATILARLELGNAERVELIDVVPSLGPVELRELLPAFARIDDEDALERLADAFRRSPVALSLEKDALDRFLGSLAPALRERGKELFSARDEDDEDRRRRIDELLATLPKGEIRRGQAIFNGERAACSTCHAIGYLGGRLGPDLTRIGQIRSRRDLLEAMIYPSESFVRSYEPTVVVTKRGEVHSGILRHESPSEIVLATSADSEARVPIDDVAETRPGETSIMPSGLLEQLTPEEIADLLAFLEATRW